MASFIAHLNKHFLNKSFIKNNLIFMVGSSFVAVLNYLFFPIIGRLISVEQFGELQAVLSIFSIIGVVLTAFGLVIAQISQETFGKEMIFRVYRLENLSIFATFLILFAAFVFRQQIKQELFLDSFWPIILVGILVVVNIPSTSRAYFLQSEEKYWELSFSALIFSASKLLFSIVSALLGLPVIGILVSITLAQILHLLFVTHKSKSSIPGWIKSIAQQTQASKKNVLSLIPGREDAKSYLFATVFLFCFTFLLTGDVVIARGIFSAEEAGIYSGIAGISKIIYFATVSVGGVLFVESIRKTKVIGMKKKYIFSFTLVLVISGIISILFSLNPKNTIVMLIGEKYLGGSGLVVIFSIFMTAMSINGLLVNLLIAQKNLMGLLGPVLGIISMYLMLLNLEQGMFTLALSFTVAALVTAVISTFVFFSFSKLKDR